MVCKDRVGPVCEPCGSALQPGAAPIVGGLDVCRARCRLDATSRPVVAAFKYKRERRLAGWIAEQIAPLVPRLADALTWIPATPERRRMRGFDQAGEITRIVASLTGVPAVALLRRDRADERQTGRSRAARLAGPGLQSNGTPPEFVVLVDDVITTGSSMRVAAETLRSCGSQRVVGVALAVTEMGR